MSKKRRLTRASYAEEQILVKKRRLNNILLDDLWDIVFDYAPQYKLHDWIPLDKINWKKNSIIDRDQCEK